MTMRIGIYTRLSNDPTGEQTATARQERACRAFAELRGWDVVEVFEDVELSAYKPGVVRPAYQRLITQVEAGQLDGVLVWKLDRLVRRPSEFERFWAVCEQAGAVIASATEPIDASTDLGLALVRILVTFAQLESATISVRIKAKHRELAEAGKAVGVTPYGWKHGMQELEPAEAALLREAADRAVAGEALSMIAKDWYQRGVRSRQGKIIAITWLRETLNHPRMVGDRIHNGEVVTRDCFASIVDRDAYAQLRAALANRAIWNSRTDHELTGLLRCGRCGSRMFRRDSTGRATYSCGGSAKQGCGRCSIRATALEAHVLSLLIGHLRRQPPAAPAPVGADALATMLETHASALRSVATRADLTAGERNALQATLVGDFYRRTGLALLDGRQTVKSGWHDAHQLEEQWPTLTTTDRRAILATRFHYIIIQPAGAGSGPRFRPERVHPVYWWTERAPGRELQRIATAWSDALPSRRTAVRSRPPRKWATRELVAAVRAFAGSTDNPTAGTYLQHRGANPDLPSLPCITRRLGSWSRALQRAQHVPRDEGLARRGSRRYTNDDLLDSLRQWLASGGDGSVHSYSDAIQNTDRPTYNTIYLRFGSWNAALNEVGGHAKRRRWSADEVEHVVTQWIRHNTRGRRGSQDYERAAALHPELPSLKTVVARLGSWDEALRRSTTRPPRAGSVAQLAE